MSVLNEPKNGVNVTVFLKTGGMKQGTVNIKTYDRFADYIERHEPSHIKLYDGKPSFMLIPVSSIDYYIQTGG